MIQNYNLLKIALKGKDNLEVLAAFKVRKFDLLFYKIKTYHLHWMASRANIVCKYLIHIYFFNIGRGFRCFFSMFFSRSSNFLSKKSFVIIFSALNFYLYDRKKCLRFLKSYFKLEIIFLSFVLSFLVDMFH